MPSALGFIIAQLGDQIFGAGRTKEDALEIALARMPSESVASITARLANGREVAELKGPGTLYIAPCTHALVGMVLNIEGLVTWGHYQGIECTLIELDDFRHKAKAQAAPDTP